MNTHTYKLFTNFIKCAAKFLSLVAAAATFSQGAAN